MNDCPNSCCQKIHLTASIVGSIVKIEFFGFSIFDDSSANHTHQIHKIIIKEYIDSDNHTTGIIYQCNNIGSLLFPIYF